MITAQAPVSARYRVMPHRAIRFLLPASPPSPSHDSSSPSGLRRLRACWLAARRTYAGHLPDRYPRDFSDGQVWREPFLAEVRPLLRPGQRILDIGSGRIPAIPVEMRAPDCHYVGVDISAQELERAAPGSYDETNVTDVLAGPPAEVSLFDLVIAWGVWEHLKPLPVAVENMRRCLKPDGWLVARTSGTFALFAVLNRLVPERVGVTLMNRLLGRRPETVFTAHYHRCWYSAIRRMLVGSPEVAIRCQHTAAQYLRFSRVAQTLFMLYEQWAFLGDHRNLAAYYVVRARA